MTMPSLCVLRLIAVSAAALVIACSLAPCHSSSSSSSSNTQKKEKSYEQQREQQQQKLRSATASSFSFSSFSSSSSSVNLEDARKGLITDLPGLDYDPGFRQYSGYLSVSGSKDHGKNIFYWYIESESHPESDPVVLWTNGGPGCSGLIGLAREHGPYYIDQHLQLSPNPYSWNKVANMLYIEQPAGVGFSYSTNPNDYDTGDHQAAADNYQLIRAFLQRFPERQGNDFYIASESYGGHYMPQLALEILRRNTDKFIKFAGVLVGNPFVDLFADALGEVGVYYQHGLTPATLYKAWSTSCATPDTYDTPDCDEIMNAIRSKAGGGINPYAIDYPVCRESSTLTVTSDQGGADDDNKPMKRDRPVKSSQVLQLERFKTLSMKQGIPRMHNTATATATAGRNNINNIVKDDISPPFLPPEDRYRPCSELHTERYLNRNDVQKALHIDQDKSPKPWNDCSNIINYSSDDFQTPVIQLYKELVNLALEHSHTLNILVFSGDDDSVCATAGTQYWIWDLGVNATKSITWEPWKVDEQTAGYVTTFEVGGSSGPSTGSANFTFATVHGAGHEVPAYRPKEALELFKKYFSGKWL